MKSALQMINFVSGPANFSGQIVSSHKFYGNKRKKLADSLKVEKKKYVVHKTLSE